MLRPESPSLYTAILTPPTGMTLDLAVGTAFSMEPSFLLQAPVYFALNALGNEEIDDPVTILEALRRYAEKFTVYVQRGRIQVPHKANIVYSLLENMTVEVQPEDGVFHPKVWALRFIAPEEAEVTYRLAILSKNMTADPSWDVSLLLEGKLSDEDAPGSETLTTFFEWLPLHTHGRIDMKRKEQTCVIAKELHRVHWQLPEGFTELKFHLPWKETISDCIPKADRLAIVSPFCSDSLLKSLSKCASTTGRLVSRPETLASLLSSTRARFELCQYLDEDAIAEADDSDIPSSGLHAKLYFLEQGRHIHIIMGSANATESGWHKNIEILVALKGSKRALGGIDDIFGKAQSSDDRDKGELGRYLKEFKEEKAAPFDEKRKEAEKTLEQARTLLTRADLKLSCFKQEDGLWCMEFLGEMPELKDTGISKALAWPISVEADPHCNILESAPKFLFGPFLASAITGLIAFELQTSSPAVAIRFVLNLPVVGLPEDERKAAVTQSVVNNRENFLRYLFLLLAGEASSSSGHDGSGNSLARWMSKRTSGEYAALMEELTKAYCQDRTDQLDKIDKLIRDLSSKDGKSVIPEDFLDLWQVFVAAREESHD